MHGKEHMCVTEEKVKEIVVQELKPLEDDFRSAKNWAIGLLTTVLLGTFGIGVWVGTISSRVDNITSNQQRFEDRVEDRLVRIEALLISLSEKVSTQK